MGLILRSASGEGRARSSKDAICGCSYAEDDRGLCKGPAKAGTHLSAFEAPDE